MVMGDDHDPEATFGRRVGRIWRMLDPRRLFVTHAQVEEARRVLAAAEEGSIASPVAALDLEEAVAVRNAVLHPDTGEPIALPLRVAAIIPANCTLDWLMIRAASMPGLRYPVLAQLCNQTYNVLHYRANRNASDTANSSLDVKAFGAAVIGSVAVTVGLTAYVDRHPKALRSGEVRKPLPRLARRLVPFAAVAVADLLNLSITRGNEWRDGVHVYDSEGESLGKSRIAGHRAVRETVLCRVLAAAGVLLGSPVIMERVDRTRLSRLPFYYRGGLRSALLLSVVAGMISVSVPLAFGIYRHEAQVSPLLLEERFHGVSGNVTYNRGL